MSANKLRIVQENKFPFDIVIMDGEEVYLTERRYAWSSSQKTVQECLAGVGMGDNKDDAIRGNAKQLEKFEEIVHAVNYYRTLDKDNLP